MQSEGAAEDIVTIPPEKREEWDKYRGADLEPLLRSGAVALLDARWVVAYAKEGRPICRRQELPKEAFLPVDALIAAGQCSCGLRVACLSYPWLQPGHPDARCSTLRLVATVLEAYLADNGEKVWGLFWVRVPHAALPPSSLSHKESPSAELLRRRAAHRTS